MTFYLNEDLPLVQSEITWIESKQHFYQPLFVSASQTLQDGMCQLNWNKAN